MKPLAAPNKAAAHVVDRFEWNAVLPEWIRNFREASGLKQLSEFLRNQQKQTEEI